MLRKRHPKEEPTTAGQSLTGEGEKHWFQPENRLKEAGSYREPRKTLVKAMTRTKKACGPVTALRE